MGIKLGGSCQCCDTCSISEDLTGFDDESLGPHAATKTLTYSGAMPSGDVKFDVVYNALADGDSLSLKLGNAFTKITRTGADYTVETNNGISTTSSTNPGNTISLSVVTATNGVNPDEHCVNNETYIEAASIPASIVIHSGTITFTSVLLYKVNGSCTSLACSNPCDIRSANGTRIIGVQVVVSGFPATAIGQETPAVGFGLPVTYQETITGLDAVNGTHLFYFDSVEPCFASHLYIAEITSFREQWQTFGGSQTNYSSATVTRNAYLVPRGMVIIADSLPADKEVIDLSLDLLLFGATVANTGNNKSIGRIGSTFSMSEGSLTRCNNGPEVGTLDVVGAWGPGSGAAASATSTAGLDAAEDKCSLAADFSSVEITCSLLY